MPIFPGDVPQAAIVAVQSAIRERAIKSAFATPGLRGTDIKSLERSTPHRVAHLSLEQIRGGGSLRQITQPGGWRFLIHGGDKVVAAGKVVMRKANEYSLSELGEGPFVTGTEAAIRFAEAMPAVQSGRFEAVLLMASEVYVVALWLVDLDGDNDIVVIIPTSPASASNPLEQMTSAAFLGKLRNLAVSVGYK